MKKLFVIALMLLGYSYVYSQNYVGELWYMNSYQYVKLSCTKGQCELSLPYLDGAKKYPTQGNPLQKKTWRIHTGLDTWTFDTRFANDQFTGLVTTYNGQQQLTLTRQLDALPKKELSKFKGIYKDRKGRKVVVYERFDFLHIISPYSEEIMSLKPIAKDTFWSVSGETSTFKKLQNNKFLELTIGFRDGRSHRLTRQPDSVIKELWIPVGKDTLYAKMYLPAGKGPFPACLILPGGGPIGLENYEFEARFFAAYGIASLVFDKSGNGQSKGEGHFNFQTFEDKNEQYKKLFSYLKNHPKVNPDKVGIHGPSEGGRLALLMAIDLKEEVAFVNAIAAPVMPFREGQFYAMDQHHRILGVSEVHNMEIQQIWDEYYDGIVAGKINPKTIDKARTHLKRNQQLFLPSSYELPASPRKEDIENNKVVAMAHQITTPIFFQNGEHDQRVNVPKSMANFNKAFDKKELVHSKIYWRGNHSLMTPELKICPGYLQDKIKWLTTIGIIH